MRSPDDAPAETTTVAARASAGRLQAWLLKPLKIARRFQSALVITLLERLLRLTVGQIDHLDRMDGRLGGLERRNDRLQTVLDQIAPRLDRGEELALRLAQTMDRLQESLDRLHLRLDDTPTRFDALQAELHLAELAEDVQHRLSILEARFEKPPEDA